ncbi:MAG: iron-sulfur cluster assembly scaffold protein, partial [Pseudomonadota bacterium]
MTDADLNQLYNREILALAASIGRTERLAQPTAVAQVTSPVCGSRIEVALVLAGDCIEDYSQQVQACALGQAAAAIMAQNAIGASRMQIARAFEQLQAILGDGVGGGQPQVQDQGTVDLVWPMLEVFEPVRAFPARH